MADLIEKLINAFSFKNHDFNRIKKYKYSEDIEFSNKFYDEKNEKVLGNKKYYLQLQYSHYVKNTTNDLAQSPRDVIIPLYCYCGSDCLNSLINLVFNVPKENNDV